MELYHPQLMPYLESLVPERPAAMQAMEAYAQQTNFPIVGPVVGQFLYLLTRVSGARRVFEMGSGYGYSTAWFAMGVQANSGGEVYHVVWDAELSRKARDYLAQLGLDSLVRFHVSEAIEQLQRTEGPFDIIFNDIQKEDYPRSVPLIKAKLRPGGLAIFDNTLWHGAIFDPNDHSAQTEAIRTLNRMLSEDPDFECSLIPLRDGVLVARLKER